MVDGWAEQIEAFYVRQMVDLSALPCTHCIVKSRPVQLASLNEAKDDAKTRACTMIQNCEEVKRERENRREYTGERSAKTSSRVQEYSHPRHHMVKSSPSVSETLGEPASCTMPTTSFGSILPRDLKLCGIVSRLLCKDKKGDAREADPDAAVERFFLFSDGVDIALLLLDFGVSVRILRTVDGIRGRRQRTWPCLPGPRNCQSSQRCERGQTRRPCQSRQVDLLGLRVESGHERRRPISKCLPLYASEERMRLDIVERRQPSRLVLEQAVRCHAGSRVRTEGRRTQ